MDAWNTLNKIKSKEPILDEEIPSTKYRQNDDEIEIEGQKIGLRVILH